MLKVSINQEGVFVNDTNWKDLSLSKKLLWTVLIPIILILALIVAILAVSIALGAVALAVPLVLAAVIIACVIGFIALVIWIPIAIIKKGKIVIIKGEEKNEN